MRVLLLDQFGDPGGAQFCLLEAAGGFAARGWELHAALPSGPVAERLSRLGAGVHPIACGPFRSGRKRLSDALLFATQLPRQAAAIRRIALRAPIDVVYVNGPRLVPAAALAVGSTPWVFHAHNVVEQAAARRLAGRMLRGYGARMVAASRFAAASLEPWLPPDRVRVIYNGVASVGIPRFPGRFARIGVLGRIAPEKGQLTFVRAARIAARAHPGLRFVVRGDALFGSGGYIDSVRLEAGPETAFLPWAHDRTALFAEIDLLAVPSGPSEASPRVILEAYAAGVPVIAFRSGGIPELIDHGDTGLLVDEPTPQALARAILEAVSQPRRLQAMAERGHSRWQARYTLGRFQSEVAVALEEAFLHARQPASRAGASAAV